MHSGSDCPHWNPSPGYTGTPAAAAHQLTASERAEFTRRRKAAYEALHPETAHGVIGNGREKSRQLGDPTEQVETPRFTADTSAKTGQSERAVQLDAERGAKVCDEALHPEAARGANQHTRGVADFATPTFADDQAAKTGQAPRTVRLDAERGVKVCDEAMALIRGARWDPRNWPPSEELSG